MKAFSHFISAVILKLEGYSNRRKQYLFCSARIRVHWILRRALSITLTITLLTSSAPAAPQTIKTIAGEWQMSLAFWLRTDFSTKLHRMLDNDAHKPQEKQETRDAKVSELKIYPGDVTIRISETVSFSAVAYDANAAPVGGVNFKW